MGGSEITVCCNTDQNLLCFIDIRMVNRLEDTIDSYSLLLQFQTSLYSSFPKFIDSWRTEVTFL